MGQKWARYTPLYWALYGLGVASHAAQPVTNTFGWMGDLAMVVPGVDEADEADEVLQGVGDAAYDASGDVSYSTDVVTTSGRIEGGPEPLKNYGGAPPRNPSELLDDTHMVADLDGQAAWDALADEAGWEDAAAEAMEVAAEQEEEEATEAAEAMEATAMEIIDTQIPAMRDAGQQALAREQMLWLMNHTRNLAVNRSPFDISDLWDHTLRQIRTYFAV
jgi:hypothetical protein